MNKVFALLVVLLSVAAVSACSSKTKEELGLERRTPDASQAISKDPLVLPPNYHLRPVVPMQKAKNN